MTISEVESTDVDRGPSANGEAKPPAKTGPTFEVLAVLGFGLALVAIMIAVFALALAARSIDEHRAIPAGGGSSPGGSVAVALSEFTITPNPISASAGAVLAVSNDGSVPHDLAVEGQNLATPELQAGGQAQLDITGLAPGTYTVFCQIAGHREAGMVATLNVS